jgi:prophage DNA circulation protein
METGTRGGGRRVALHEYPKRSIDYAEDMGRRANRFSIHGYLIGPDYLTDKDKLIDALEADGPGTLRLPLQYMAVDVEVMVQNYSATESRERGGVCTIEMEFVEYGTPFYRPTISTTAVIAQAATKVENAVVGPNEPTSTTAQQAAPYGQVLQGAAIQPPLLKN